MAENSLQNQKNETSFVMSDKAKAIIEKFEKQIENHLIKRKLLLY